jgi:hypothetical protein
MGSIGSAVELITEKLTFYFVFLVQICTYEKGQVILLTFEFLEIMEIICVRSCFIF